VLEHIPLLREMRDFLMLVLVPRLELL